MNDDHTLEHLDAMCDERGLFEHADHLTPRHSHGYCSDDNARLLAVTSLLPDEGVAHRLSRLSLQFVLSAQVPDGRCHNRMNALGNWTDAPSTNDCWGRCLWGLGHAAVFHQDAGVREAALRGFDHSAPRRSRWSRAMAFAAIGAADVLAEHPANGLARTLLGDAADAIGPLPVSGDWRWPEERLRYANAALAEAMIAAGAALERPDRLHQGLEMLEWLLSLETERGHLSVTGTGGRLPGETGPQFDQQPIEVAAIADACWRALTVTGDDRWTRGITTAAAWFEGANDAGLRMFDPASHGGYDGLHERAVNLNQGAESTLAYVSTMFRVAQLAGVA